ncbi:MAG TPA: hypothetical protein VJ696_06895, partial [Rhodanobacteraceae bacterium]|nr:hypothetical protein [Rhodanobacteraceae bacterium]
DLPRYYAELADLQTAHHDIAGGEESARRALASAKAIHGENHVDVAQCEVRLGRLLFDTDREAEGFALIESARAKTLALRGADDGFHTPFMLYQYGAAEVRRGRIEDGLASLEAAIANRRRHRPGTIPLAQFLESAAQGRIALGRFDDAERALDEAGAIRAEAGQSAPSAMLDPAIVLRMRLALARGDAHAAAALIPQLSSSRASAEPLDRQIVLDRLAAADVASASGDRTAAIAAAAGVRRMIEASDLVRYYGSLLADADFVEGEAHLRAGDARAASAPLERALAARERSLDASSPDIAETEIALAEARLATSDVDGARQLADAAAKIDAAHAALGPQYRTPLRRLRQTLAASPRALSARARSP